MPPLDKTQLEEFLTSGSHLMKLATITPEGWPSINPVWYHYDGEAFLVAGRTKAAWVGNIQQNSKVSACIDTCEAPYTRVLVEATAVVEDMGWLGDWRSWSVRYLGEEAGNGYYERTRHMPRALVKITPNKIITWAGSEWHPRYTT